ncbi:MAG TPA: hypothetical protein VFJ82_25920 [Longimicrobium sp.]|nr:hypothetical protein [Longimicrobium sp.]
MQHLTLEALARLVDEPPGPDEAAHVASCLVCRRDLDEMRAQTDALAGLDDQDPAPEAWFRLETALRAEGLIRDEPVRPAARYAGRGWLRIAAGVALFLLGGAAGVYLRGHSPGRVASRPETMRGDPVVVRPGADGGRFASSRPVAGPDVEMEGPMVVEPVTGMSGARLTSTGGSGTAPAPRRRPPSPAEAAAARELAEAEAGYLAALQRYANIADPQSGADAATRMAALERMVATTRAALESAPDDPVINGYHLAALRERDELRRQMAQTAENDWF